MVHRHCGNYKPLMEEGCMANLFYIVIGSHEVNDGKEKVYDCISTRFEQLTLNEADVRAYLRIGMISAGCRIDENGKIELASLEFKGAVPTKTVEMVKENVVKELEKKEEVVKTEVKEPEQPKVTEPEKKPEPAKPEVKEPDKNPEPAKPVVKEPEKKPEDTKSKAVEPKKEVSKKSEKTTK